MWAWAMKSTHFVISVSDNVSFLAWPELPCADACVPGNYILLGNWLDIFTLCSACPAKHITKGSISVGVMIISAKYLTAVIIDLYEKETNIDYLWFLIKN